MFPCFHCPSKTSRKGISGGTLGLPWSLWQGNNGLFCLQSSHGHRVAIYPLKYIKLYLWTEERACWKALSIGVAFYISKRLEAYGCLKDLCIFREESNFERSFMCTSFCSQELCVPAQWQRCSWFCVTLVIGPGFHCDLAGSSGPFQLSPLSTSGSHVPSCCTVPIAPVWRHLCQKVPGAGTFTCLRTKLKQDPHRLKPLFWFGNFRCVTFREELPTARCC